MESTQTSISSVGNILVSLPSFLLDHYIGFLNVLPSYTLSLQYFSQQPCTKYTLAMLGLTKQAYFYDVAIVLCLANNTFSELCA